MNKKIIEKYIGLFSNLKPNNVKDFDNLVSKDIRFVDPFNNVKGVENFKKIFYHMFEKTQDPKFSVITYTIKNKNVFLKWKMTFYAFKYEQSIEGISELTFNKVGKITSHVDYWDSLNGLFIKLPYVGFLYRISLKIFRVKI